MERSRRFRQHFERSSSPYACCGRGSFDENHGVGIGALHVDASLHSRSVTIVDQSQSTAALVAARMCSSTLLIVITLLQKQRAVPSDRCVGSSSCSSCIRYFHAVKSRYWRRIS